MPDDDLKSYIEYLQRQILTEDTEAMYDHAHYKEWTVKNRERLQTIAKSLRIDKPDDLLEQLERSASDFEPETKYDSFYSRKIFEVVLEDVKMGVADAGLSLSRPVIFANSTDLSSGPMSRTSEGDHLLFVGTGTYSFCNYWARAFTAILMEISKKIPKQMSESASVETALKENCKLLVLPTQLVARYGWANTLVGFGEVHQPEHYTGLRLELLKAMEVFVVGHEFGHFFVEEKKPGTNATNDSDEAKRLEFTCDTYGFLACRHFGVRNNNWSAFSASAVVLLFRGLEMSHKARVLFGLENDDSNTHPSFEKRISNILQAVAKNTAPDQFAAVENNLEEIFTVCDSLEKLVFEVIQETIDYDDK